MDIFKNFDKDKGGNLDPDEFYKMMAVIDPRITYNEAMHIFNEVDTSKDGHVSVQEFNSIFNEYDFRDVNDIAGRIIVDLKEIIKAHDINVRQIFDNFDKDKSGDL